MTPINFTQINPQAKAKEAEAVTLAEINMKIDKILKYQKSVRNMAIFRGFMSFIFFLVFIVLPIIGSFYLISYLKEKGIDLKKVSSQYQEMYKTMDELKEQAGQLNELGEKVGGVYPHL